jgi:hypothetical protein
MASVARLVAAALDHAAQAVEVEDDERQRPAALEERRQHLREVAGVAEPA